MSYESDKKKLEEALTKSLGSRVSINIEYSGPGIGGTSPYYSLEVSAEEPYDKSTGNFSTVNKPKGDTRFSGEIKKDPKGGVFVEKETTGRFNTVFSKSEAKDLGDLLDKVPTQGKVASTLVEMLDRVANTLEEKGLTKEAEAIDEISNALDKEASDEFQKPSDTEVEKDKEFIKELESFSKKVESKYKDKKVPSFKIENLFKWDDGSKISSLIKTIPDADAKEGDHGTIDGLPGRVYYHSKSWTGTAPDMRRLRYAMEYLNYILRRSYTDYASGSKKAPAVTAVYNRGNFSCDIKLAPEPKKINTNDDLDF
jgi:hypothetical protein